MSQRRNLPRLLLAALAATCIAVPTAYAMPIDPQGTTTQDKRQQDMHASTVKKADRTTQDARGESAATRGTAGAASEPRLQGPPTWPSYPTPLPRPAQQPIATDGGGDDIGTDLPVALLVLAGTLALGGGLAVVAMKVRVHTRTAH
jgi:hypothetical protein